MAYQAAIFDLDGTLIDSLADLADSANDMLASYGFPQHELDEYRYFVGNGPRKLMERCLPKPQSEDPAFVDEALERYNQCYSHHILNKTKPYDGILPMLEALQKQGIPLAICTNKQQFASDIIVAKLFPEGMFRENIGDREGMPRKPDPTKVLRIARNFGVQPEEVAYLGDTCTDMETAKNAGFLPIGVAWGFRPKEELLETGAKVLLEHPMELLEKVSFVNEEQPSDMVQEPSERPPLPKHFFVDYENVSVHGLQGLLQLEERDMVCIFYSENANSITFELHNSLNLCKAQIRIQKVEVGYKNALDFQLSSYLGFVIGKNEARGEEGAAEYFIVTRDAAFSCVSDYWREQGVSVQIVSNVAGRTGTLKARQDSEPRGETNAFPLDVASVVRSRISDVEDAEFALKCIRQCRTKQAVHAALQKRYPHGERAKLIYQAIKSLLKE